MAFTNSSLISVTKLSPNNSGERIYPITRITPHCVVDQCSAETIGNILQIQVIKQVLITVLAMMVESVCA